MPPELYQTLTQKMQSLDNPVTRVIFPDGVRLNTMKNRILRVAAELNIPVTIRRVLGGLLCWRSTDEDLQQAHEGGTRLQTAQRKGQSRPGRRRNAHARVDSPS
jgi:hypothetical protein